MKDILVFAGRLWRNLNRRVSRLTLAASGVESGPVLSRLGTSENGWYVPEGMPAEALCYCIGVGLDASFDFELAKTDARVVSFDPTPKAVAYMERENNGQVIFHPWGLMDRDGTLRLYEPLSQDHGSHFAHDLHRTNRFHEVECYRFATILEKLGHATPYLVKMDIEGSWFEVIQDMMRDSIHPKVLEVEYDSPAPVWRVMRIHRQLKAAGYRLVLRQGDNAVYML